MASKGVFPYRYVCFDPCYRFGQNKAILATTGFHEIEQESFSAIFVDRQVVFRMIRQQRLN